MLEKNKGKLSNLSHLFHIMSHHRSSPRQRLFFVVCVFIENIRTSCLTSLMDIITDVSQQASWKSWTFWKLETCRKSLINSYQEEVSNFMWLFLGIMLRPLRPLMCHSKMTHKRFFWQFLVLLALLDFDIVLCVEVEGRKFSSQIQRTLRLSPSNRWFFFRCFFVVLSLYASILCAPSCGFICNLFLYIVHWAICKQLTHELDSINIGAEFVRSFSFLKNNCFVPVCKTKSWVIEI